MSTTLEAWHPTARPPRARAPSLSPWRVPDDFDPPARAADPASPEAPSPETPPLTEADVAAARDAGRREANATEAAEAARRDGAALERIAQAIERERGAAASVAERSAAAMAALLVRTLATAFPTLESRLGPAEAAAFVQAVLPGLVREPAVVLRAAAPVARLLGPLAGIVVEVDPALGAGDVLVTWQDGAARRDGAAIRAAILAVLDRIAPPDLDDSDCRDPDRSTLETAP